MALPNRFNLGGVMVFTISKFFHIVKNRFTITT
nr:MAG TPA: hypothetical protein [Caudoviricetes sp.]